MARARWVRQQPAAYEIKVLRGCECLPETIGPVTILVRRGQAESRYYARTQEPVPVQYAPLFPTVDGLFELIEEAARQGAARLDVTYNPRFGYPVRVNIDYRADHADDEIAYLVQDFAAR